MGARILVVDDEPSATFLIKQIFRREIRSGDYEMVFAQNGKVALATLAQESVDVVLSDINMPEMDGLTLLEEIASSFPRIRVIMVSAYNDMPRIRHAMNYGAFDYITKPIDARDLRETIKKLIGFIERGSKPTL